MFEKFGEFDSAKEINEKAAALIAEGKTEGLKILALENGFEEEDVLDYLENPEVDFCTVKTAAVAKLQEEKKDLKPVEIMEDWYRYIEQLCIESEDIAAAVRKKGKSLKGCISSILKWSFQNSYSVDQGIVRASGINASNVKMGIPGMMRAKVMIREYYLEG